MQITAPSEQDRKKLWLSRFRYAGLGAAGGIALAVIMLIACSVDASEIYRGGRGALRLAVGALFGVIVGLDLHSTRTWRRFGKYTFAIRFILACSAGGTGLGLGGMLLGIVMASDVWKYGVGGAVLGVLLLLRIKLENISFK